MPATSFPERCGWTIASAATLTTGAIQTLANCIALPRHRLVPTSEDGKTLPYILGHETQDEIEVGNGLYSSASNTITRAVGTDLLFSTTGTTVSFSSGNKICFIGGTGELAKFLFQMRGHTAIPMLNQTIGGTYNSAVQAQIQALSTTVDALNQMLKDAGISA